MKVPKSRVAIRIGLEFQDFDTSGVRKWRRQHFGNESPKNPEE
jgi:hypothetical protein